MADSLMISPPQIYFVNGDTCKLNAGLDFSGATGFQTVVAGVTGKIHRLMGMILQSPGTVGSVAVYSNSGGTVILSPITAPAASTGNAFVLPIADSGYCETLVGQALAVGVSTQAVNGSYFYITYKPL